MRKDEVIEKTKKERLACLTLARAAQLLLSEKKSRLVSSISKKSDKSIKVVFKVGAPAVWHKRIV